MAVILSCKETKNFFKIYFKKKERNKNKTSGGKRKSKMLDEILKYTSKFIKCN